MDKDVELALQDRQEMLDSGKKWVRLLIQFQPFRSILLEWGYINYRGMRETELETRRYYLVNNTAEYVRLIHP